MIIAIISDVHANLEALQTVLEDVRRQGAERLWCLGDVVGYGADPNPVCDRIAAQADLAIAGNHDWAAVGKMKIGYFNSAAAVAIDWTAEQLSDPSREWLAALPLLRIEGEARLVHATPSDPAGWQYVLSSPDAEAELESYQETLCFIGHSHFPAVYESDGTGLRYLQDERVPLVAGRRYLVNVAASASPATATRGPPICCTTPRAGSWSGDGWSTTSTGPRRRSWTPGSPTSWPSVCSAGGDGGSD